MEMKSIKKNIMNDCVLMTPNSNILGVTPSVYEDTLDEALKNIQYELQHRL